MTPGMSQVVMTAEGGASERSFVAHTTARPHSLMAAYWRNEGSVVGPMSPGTELSGIVLEDWSRPVAEGTWKKKLVWAGQP